ncbi:MAG: PrgI family protein [Lachnospiraceae bacterium]|nr:PrgI family protein [Lachnospiraceae bacterium]
MIIEINKDIDRYQESIAMGLTAKQLICSVASVASGGIIVFLLYPYIGLTVSAYVTIPVVAPIAFSGFYSYNDMSFMEVMKRKMHFMFKNKVLLYESTESETRIKEYEIKDNKVKNKKSKHKKERI